MHNKSNFYAVKSVSKRDSQIKPGLSEFIINEKEILLTLNHPFVVRLVKTLKNDYFYFYIMEYVNGLNFEERLTNRTEFRNTQEFKFYMASSLLTSDYLSIKQVAHPDIKPSNIMLDSNGFIKLIDFGTSKRITDVTYTIIGTPHYIAPEIIQGKGNNYTSDYWTIVVTMYQIYYGTYPFGNSICDILEIYNEILYK
jgi:cGMP-dependent protein kinase